MLDTLRGTGSTLTTYVYQNAPTGEGNQPTKAYAAAFVLLMIVLLLNVGVDLAGRGGKARAMELKPPPVRRLPLEPLRPAEVGHSRRTAVPMPTPAPAAFAGAPRRHAPAATFAIDRMPVEDLSIAYGPKLAVDYVSLPIRQGEVLALIGPSGCGKTTLLRSLNRLTELTRTASMTGRITLDGEDISASTRPRCAAA